MNAPAKILPFARSEEAVTPWHTTEDARRFLMGCRFRPPVLKNHMKTYFQTRDEWQAYDETDSRYEHLQSLRFAHSALYLANPFACRDGRTATALGCSVHEAIDAVQDKPRLFNLSDPDERKSWEHLRAEILGDAAAVRMGRVAS